MKRPHSELASAINPDSVLIVNEAIGRDQADVRSEEETSLLGLIDGKRTVAEILQLSRMSGFVAMRRLRALLERQVIRPGGRTGTAAPQPNRGGQKGARLGLTQDLTSAAEAFAATAQIRRGPGTEDSPKDPARTAPGITNVQRPGEDRATPLQGSAPLPSVIIAFGPEFLDSRRAPTRRISSPEALMMPPARAPAPVPQVAEAPRPALQEAPPPTQSTALVPSSASQRAITTVNETTVMPKVGQRPKHRRRGTPHSTAEIQAQELWLSVTRREWQTLAVVSAHGGGAALSVASALAEAGTLLRGKSVELFIAEGADLSSSGEWSWGGRASRPVTLPTGGLPAAAEKFERVVALEPLTSNPRGVTIAQSAEAVLMVAEAGQTELRAARKAIEMIGRDRFLGCVLVSRR
jgi:hypothetical protein